MEGNATVWIMLKILVTFNYDILDNNYNNNNNNLSP